MAIGSPHFQVAERALFLWHNEYISNLIAEYRNEILPILYPILHQNSHQHWNPTVASLAVNVLKIFVELDSPLVDSLAKSYEKEENQREQKKILHQTNWKKLEEKFPFHPAAVNGEEISQQGKIQENLTPA